MSSKKEQYATKQTAKTHDVFRIRYLKFNTILKINELKSALTAKEMV